MNAIHHQLLSLLRTALWGHPADHFLFEKGADWRALLRLADKQTVVGVVYDGILALPSRLQPPTDLLRQMHLHTVRIAQSHSLLNERLAEIVLLLQAEGISSVLLKGQGVARNYPDPLRRTCGDIDLYVGANHYERVCTLCYEKGMLGESAAESIQHLHFDYKGVNIEIHRIAGVMFDGNRNRLFRRWSDHLLQGSTCRRVQINDMNVSLPPVRFDVFFIFYHTYKHFITGGVGLRQLCDWAMYLHAFRDEIDRDLLLKDLKRFHLLRAWRMMGTIVVEHLGLPEEDFPFYHATPTVKKVAHITMELIWKDGNFGFHNPGRTQRPDGYLPGKLHSFRSVHRRLWRVFPLCPADIWCYYRTYLYNGISQIYKEKFTTQTITGTER